MSRLCFIDTETVGLDPDAHPIWELALIIDDLEYLMRFDVDPNVGDPIALNLSGFHERHWRGNHGGGKWMASSPVVVDRWESIDAAETLKAEDPVPRFGSAKSALQTIASLTHGCHLVGAVVSFDEERLRRWMHREGVVPSWHYHLIDVEALVVGRLGTAPPWDSQYLSTSVGVDPDRFDRHTALGDARWAKALYEAVMS